MDFARFLERFAEVREDTGGYLVPCPAHDDARPSLFLTLKDDGRMLVYCRAGCERGDVLDALGLRERDLFGWVPGAGVTPVRGGTSLPAPGPEQVAGLRAWLDLLPVDDGGYATKRFGLSLDDMGRLGLRFADAASSASFAYLSPRFRRYPRLVVPLVGFDGVARGAQGRDLSGQCEARWVSLANRKDRDDPNPVAWAKYGVFRGGGDYGVWVITEGPSDALTVAAVGYDAVCVRGASLASNPELAREIAEGVAGDTVVIAGDPDKAGMKFTRALADALRERGVTPLHIRWPDDIGGRDITAWRESDPDGFASALHVAIRMAYPIGAPKEAKRAAKARDLDKRTGTDSVSRDDGERAAELLAGLMERYGDTDTLRAHALVAFSGGRIKYAPGLGYYVWTGRRWETSEHRVRQEIHRMGAALALAGKTDAARGFLMRVRIDNLMTELRAVPAVHVSASAFDSNTELLSFRNGTINLRTGEFRDHDMRDMITRYVDADYQPDATAPRWERFLREIFPQSDELPAYLRRLVGYGITGDTSEQCFVVLWGKGANGKSVLTDTLTGVFREITVTPPFSTFEAKASGGIPNDLAMLRGARLAFASEGQAGKAMDEAVLKRVTGQDTITARFLRKEFFEFKPAFLLALATNHKPRFAGQDDGLWRRVKLIHFPRFFRPDERDHTLTDTLRQEAPGIIAWAVRGAREWYDHGLQDPAVIREATREYRETSDPLAGFFPGVLVPDDTGRVLGNDAFSTYLEWCEAENLPAKERWTRRGFYSAMEERGAVRRSTNRGIALDGVRVADQTVANTSAGGGPNGSEGGRTKVFER